jgi:flavin reductase (DIM6/NTAB) family NADH-FMN oxidoreductase RutF
MTTGDELRQLMRRYPHGVAVLTVDHDGNRMGVTISSLVSLALEPPLIGVSIGHAAACHELVRRARAFGVSLLGAAQDDYARRFAAGYPPIVHWQEVETRRGPAGVAPLLVRAAGWLECRTEAEHLAGDHTFFVASVLSVEPGPEPGALVYRQHEYHALCQ